jgi:hypothetical protein
MSARLSEGGHEEEDIDVEHNCWWNINTVSILCWRGEFTITPALSTLMTSWTLRIMPIPITFFLIALIMAIEDQGFIWKSKNAGDGLYDNLQFRWSVNGVMNEPMLKFRPQDESTVCMNASACAYRPIVPVKYCTPLNSASSTTCVNFFGWDYDDNCDRYIFTHCMPWEFADVCIATKLNEANYSLNWNKYYSRTAAFLSSANATWVHPDRQSNSLRERTCRRYSLSDWSSIQVSQDSIAAAINEGVIPPQLRDSRDIVLRIATENAVIMKTPSSKNDDVSFFVYHFFASVYSLRGFGDAHWMEVAALVFFNQYISWAVFLPEVMQLQQQFCIYFEHLKDDNYKPTCSLMVFRMFFCDLFLGLRIYFIGLMIDCSAMIMSWQHGVMEITISALAILFLFDMDDVMMKVMKESFDLKKSRFFKGGLEDWIKGSIRKNNEEITFRFPCFGHGTLITQQRKVKLVFAMFLTSILSAINLWLSLIVASGLQKDYSLFYPDMIKIRVFVVCLAIAMLMTLSGFCCLGWQRNVCNALRITFSFVWSFTFVFFLCSNILLGWNNGWMPTATYVTSRFTNMFENGFNIISITFFFLHLTVLVVQSQGNRACDYLSLSTQPVQLDQQGESEITAQSSQIIEN